MKFNIGQMCKCLNPYAYRGEEPFIIVGIKQRFKASDGRIRAAYIVKYADGKIDQIPVKNEGGYEMVLVTDELEKDRMSQKFSGKFRNRFRDRKKQLQLCGKYWNCKVECGRKRFLCEKYWKKVFGRNVGMVKEREKQ